MDNLRRAIVIISTVVLIGAGVIGFMFALDSIVESAQDSVVDLMPTGEKYSSGSSPQNTASPEKASDCSTMLFVITDKSGNAEIVFTATADYNGGKISLIFYPADTSVAVRSEDGSSELMTIADYYKNEGLEKTGAAVSGILALPLSGAVSCNYSTLSDLINAFTIENGVSYFPPCQISAKSVDGTNVNVKKERARFTGYDSIKLISFYKTFDNIYDAELIKFYDGTRLPQNIVAATYADAFVTEKLTGDIYAYCLDNYAVFFNSFLEKCGGKAGENFPDKLSLSVRSFKEDSIDAYVIDTKIDPSGSVLVYAGTLTKYDNNSGSIASRKLSGEALNQLIKSLY